MTSADDSGPEGHDHDLKPTLLAFLVIIALGLVAGIVLSYVQAQRTGQRLHALEEYVQGKGEQRDRENARLREEIRQGQCALLDQLPAGGLLDRPRQTYGCGPGIPLDQLTPEEQAQLPSRKAPPRPAATTTPAAPIPQEAPTQAPAPPVPASPTPTPPSQPTSGPELLCGLLPPLC